MVGEASFPLFPTFAFLGFVVSLIPIPWHLQGWNAGTCLYMIWVSLACLVEFVDSVVWNGNINDPAPVWCDITTKFLIGAGIGIPASSLCINRRLYHITSLNAANITRQEKRRAIFEDMGIAIGIPVLVMALHTVVQGHRYNILEDVGCTPDIWNTPPAYPLVFIWPVLLGCISFVYAAFTLRSIWRRRAQFNQLLSSNSALATSRYIRLMLLCCVEMACTIPLGAFSIFINNDGVPIQPYISWANAHYDFSYVGKVPALIWMSNPPYYISVEMGRWIYPGSAFLFFALFGFAEEARRHYKLAFWAVVRCLGLQPSPEKAKLASFQSFRLTAKKGSSFETTSPSTEDYLTPPPKSKRPPRPTSLSSSFFDSVIDIGIEHDLEKATDISSTTLTFPESVKTATHRDSSEHYVTIPPLSPETPSYPLTTVTVVPCFHRPFATTVVPMGPSQISEQSAVIEVRQEASTVVDSV